MREKERRVGILKSTFPTISIYSTYCISTLILLYSFSESFTPHLKYFVNQIVPHRLLMYCTNLSFITNIFDSCVWPTPSVQWQSHQHSKRRGHSFNIERVAWMCSMTSHAILWKQAAHLFQLIQSRCNSLEMIYSSYTSFKGYVIKVDWDTDIR